MRAPTAYELCLDDLYTAYQANGLKLEAGEARSIIAKYSDSAIEDGFLMDGVRFRVNQRANRQELNGAARDRLADRRQRTKANEEYCRRHRIHISEVATHRLNAALMVVQENAEKAAKYDKVVELLDTWMVGGVRLGECTKDKLLAEAAKYQSAAADLSAHAGVYSRLAGHLRPGETVRTSTKRSAMLDILLALKSAE